jgi:hypothetical protein
VLKFNINKERGIYASFTLCPIRDSPQLGNLDKKGHPLPKLELIYLIKILKDLRNKN